VRLIFSTKRFLFSLSLPSPPSLPVAIHHPHLSPPPILPPFSFALPRSPPFPNPFSPIVASPHKISGPLYRVHETSVTGPFPLFFFFLSNPSPCSADPPSPGCLKARALTTPPFSPFCIFFLFYFFLLFPPQALLTQNVFLSLFSLCVLFFLISFFPTFLCSLPGGVFY